MLFSTPLCARIAGLDLCIFGPPPAHHVHLFSSSPIPSPAAHYPNRTQSLTASPKGFRVNAYQRTIGHGSQAYALAAHALETGEAMELPWIHFWRRGQGHRWAIDDSVIIVARIFPFIWLANVNTVVSVDNHHHHRRPHQNSSLTLTWGTTPRHVLRGEETIQLSKQSNGDVVFYLRSFSRPNALVAWIAHPYTVFLQRRFAKSVADKLDDIANQRITISPDTPPPVERGKAREENLHGVDYHRHNHDE